MSSAASLPEMGKILEQIFIDAPEYLVVLDPDLTIRAAGAVFRDSVGIDESARTGFLDTVETFSLSRARQVFEELQSGDCGHRTLEIHHRGENGNAFGVSYSWVACEDGIGSCRAFVGIGRDILPAPTNHAEVEEVARELNDLKQDLQRRTQEIGKLRQKLEAQSFTDELTQLPNRRFVVDRLKQEAASAVRYGSPLTIALANVDNLTHINESQGRDAGDRVLTAIADMVKNQIRSSDIAARYDSDEFLILCPHTDRPSAQFLAERLRRRVAELSFTGEAGEFGVTVCIGMVTVKAGDSPDLEVILGAAEKALEAAQLGGVNRVKMMDVG